MSIFLTLLLLLFPQTCADKLKNARQELADKDARIEALERELEQVQDSNTAAIEQGKIITAFQAQEEWYWEQRRPCVP